MDWILNPGRAAFNIETVCKCFVTVVYYRDRKFCKTFANVSIRNAAQDIFLVPNVRAFGYILLLIIPKHFMGSTQVEALEWLADAASWVTVFTCVYGYFHNWDSSHFICWPVAKATEFTNLFVGDV